MSSETSPRKASRRRHSAVVVAVFLAIVALVAVGAQGAGRQRLESARNNCRNAYGEVASAKDEYLKVLESDDVHSARAVSEKEVADTSTVTRLRKDVQPIDAVVDTCPLMSTETSVLVERANELKKLSDRYTLRAQQLKADVKAVNASVHDYQLNQAILVLSHAVDNAEQLLKDSQGSVAQESTRDDLKASLATAKKLLKRKKKVEARIEDATADLASKQDAVKQSQAQKSDEDKNKADADDSTGENDEAQSDGSSND